jgi:hypothetical protein
VLEGELGVGGDRHGVGWPSGGIEQVKNTNWRRPRLRTAVAALEASEGKGPVGGVVGSGQALVGRLALPRHLELLAVDLGEEERLGLGLRLPATDRHEGGQHGHRPEILHLGALLDPFAA